MFLQVYTSRGTEYVRIVESYRDPVTKKPKQRVLKSFGSKKKLLEQDPLALEKLQQEILEKNQEMETVREEHLRNRLEAFLDSDKESAFSDGFPVKNYGVLAYRKLWKDLNLDYFFTYRQQTDSKIQFPVKEIVQTLVTARLLDPDSKKATYEKKGVYLQDTEFSLEHVYRSLPFLAEQKDNLEAFLHRQLQKKMTRDLSVAFYDVTTYYFESIRADDLKNFGYSKDNKVNQVQVVMGLLIDKHGIPITYSLFSGNTSEFKTLEPVLRKLKAKYGIQKIILTAARGLNAKANLALIRELGYEYVMAHKIRTASASLKNEIFSEEDYTVVTPSFRYKEIPLTQTVKKEGKTHQFEDRLLLTWSASRAEKDRRDRERLIQKSIRLVASKAQLKAEMKKGGKKYVQVSFLEDEPASFNETLARKDARYDGYYAIVTSDSSLTQEQILGTYEGLWKIEESFRVLKTNLETRPIYVSTQEGIQGHFAICYLALVLQRYLEFLLREKGVEASTELIQCTLRNATVTIVPQEQGTGLFLRNEKPPLLDAIYEVLGLESVPAMGYLNEIA